MRDSRQLDKLGVEPRDQQAPRPHANSYLVPLDVRDGEVSLPLPRQRSPPAQACNSPVQPLLHHPHARGAEALTGPDIPQLDHSIIASGSEHIEARVRGQGEDRRARVPFSDRHLGLHLKRALIGRQVQDLVRMRLQQETNDLELGVDNHVHSNQFDIRSQAVPLDPLHDPVDVYLLHHRVVFEEGRGLVKFDLPIPGAAGQVLLQLHQLRHRAIVEVAEVPPHARVPMLPAPPPLPPTHSSVLQPGDPVVELVLARRLQQADAEDHLPCHFLPQGPGGHQRQPLSHRARLQDRSVQDRVDPLLP
mmetsp:Transcript_35545/g.111204  ORF Transcript_35545/g.111204 Transcript_35545/m.111204 type:complete len:305 (+) Transcript_35545:910-1824(+)